MEAIHEQQNSEIFLLVTKTVHQNQIKGDYVITKKNMCTEFKGRISKDLECGV